jgi:hypothetical protein
MLTLEHQGSNLVVFYRGDNSKEHDLNVWCEDTKKAWKNIEFEIERPTRETAKVS